MADLTLRLVKGSPLTNAEVDANFSSLNEAITVGGEPMGHEDRTTSTISFNASTRTFTIAPVSGSFVVWCKGEKVVVSSAQTVVIPNTTGMHSIYYDENGTLSSKLGYFTFSTEAPTAYVYWNATTGAAPYFGDERHGVVLDWQTHEYLHRTRGAAIANGFLASGYTLDSSATDADTQIAIESGTFFDEDMKIDIVSTATPTAGTYQQNLLFPAKIPVLHLQGTSWVMDAPTNFPFKQGTSRPQYNSLSGGVWSTTDVGNHQHATTWILATNNLTYPVIAIIGQSATDNQGEAEAFSFADLTLTGFPSVEFRPLYKLIYKASDSYANNVNAQLVSIVDLRSISAVGSAANPATDHGNLSGLSDDDHPQYLSVDTVRSPSAAVKNSFLPAQSSNNGKFLTTDGTNPSWATMTAPNNGALTLAVSGTGLSGSASFTADQAGNSTFTVTSNATSANTSGAIVARDGSGNFSANVITAVSFTGSASGLTGLKTVNGQSVLGSGNIQIDGGVTSFNTRTGAITLSSGDVTGALGFTPYNSTNPNGYTTNVGTVVGVTAGTGLTGGTVTSSGTIALATSGVTAGTYTKLTVDAYGRATVGASLSSGDVTGALGFTPYNSTNPSGFISGINSSMVTTALGFTPYNSTNPSGFITSSALSSYLPLSGGTLTGALGVGDTTTASITDQSNYSNPLVIQRSSNAGKGAVVLRGSDSIGTAIEFGRSNPSAHWGTYLSFLTHSDDVSNGTTALTERLRVQSTSVNSLVALLQGGNQVLHAGNYSSYALPLSGGTITGSTSSSTPILALNVSGSGTFQRGVRMLNSGMAAGNSLMYAVGQADNARNMGQLYFYYAGAGSNSNRLSAGLHSVDDVFNIFGSGNVMIGTTSDSGHKFNVSGTMNSTGALTQAGNQVLHAGNYSSYALPLSGGTLSGDLITRSIRVPHNDYELSLGYNGTGNGVGVYFNSGADGVYFYNRTGGGNSVFVGRSGGLNVVTGALTQAGNQVLHAGNYNSYSPTLTGTGASGSWGINVTGTANNITAYTINQNLGTGNSPTFASIITSSNSVGQNVRLGDDCWIGDTDLANTFRIRGYQNAAAGYIVFGSDLTQFGRNGTGALTWGGNAVIHAGNYNSYSPTLTGGGASGTWAISVTGSSASTTGNAATATALQTARTIGGVSFNGTANINLPGVNTEGNQNTTGNAATATSATTASGVVKTVSGTSSAELVRGNMADNDQFRILVGGTSTNAGYAEIATADDGTEPIYVRQYTGVFSSLVRTASLLDGSGNTSFPGTVTASAFSGNATTATTLQTARTINGVSFNGSANITVADSTKLPLTGGTMSGELTFSDDNEGITLLGGARVYKKLGSGLTLRRHTAETDPLVENNAGTSSWTILHAGNSQNYRSRSLNSARTTNVDFNSLNTAVDTFTAGTNYIPSGGAYNQPADGDHHYLSWGGIEGQNVWGAQIDINFYDDRVWFRRQAGANWQAWRQFIHDGNYNSYSPTLTGSGASGTWGISINGSAASISGFNNPTTAATANTIAYRDAAGDIAVRELVMSVAVQSFTPSSLVAIYPTTNQAVKVDAAGARAFLDVPTKAGSGASGTWGISVTGYAAQLNGYGNQTEHTILDGPANGPVIKVRYDSATANRYLDIGFKDGYGNFYTGLKFYNGDVPTWNGSTVLHAGNYSSYALPLSGGTVTGVAYFLTNFGGRSGDTANAKLQAYSTGNNSAFMSFHKANHYAINMGLDDDNVFRIGGWSASANRFQMDMSGNLTMAGNVTAYSDESLKKDWAPVATDFVARLAELKHGTYTRIDSGERQAGASAQDWQKLLPEVVNAGADGILSLAYGNAAVVSAIELAKDNVELRARIERLESLIEQLLNKE